MTAHGPRQPPVAPTEECSHSGEAAHTARGDHNGSSSAAHGSPWVPHPEAPQAAPGRTTGSELLSRLPRPRTAGWSPHAQTPSWTSRCFLCVYTRAVHALVGLCRVFMHAGTCRCLWACVHMCVPMWEQSWRGRLCCRAQPCASLGLGLGMWLTSGSLCAGLPLDKVWGPIVWHPQSCWAHSVMVELTWEAGNMVLASGMPGI